MNRRGLAAAILITWVLVLGWHVRREYFPSAAQRLALGIRSLPPGVAYYAIFRGADRAGWGQTEIDTLPAASGFRVRERLFIELSGRGPTGATERTTETFLGADLDLDSLRQMSILGRDTIRLRATVAGDSVVRLAVDAGPAPESIRISAPVTTTTGWRLRLAAAGEVRAGDTYAVDVFDPIAAVARPLAISVLEQTDLTFPDSADTDSISGDWIPVREDTVEAWLVSRRAAGLELRSWVDEDGRLVDGEIAAGLRLERTAFELAFFTRPGGPAGTPAPSAEDTVSAEEEHP